MNRKIFIIAMLLCTAFIYGGFSYAGNGGGGMGAGMGGGTGAGMSGGTGTGMGGDHGMMGGQGHGMMDYGQNYSNPSRGQRRTDPAYQHEKKATERLRYEIMAKRQELSDLYRSEKPNKELIDQKIAELDELEAKLDQKLFDKNLR